MLDSVLDIFWLGKGIGVATRLRDAVGGVAADADFVRAARRGLLPLPVDDYPDPRTPFRRGHRLDIPALTDHRIGVAATGGSGAMASLVGVLRAFEEAGAVPSALSVCSGSGLFGFLWASGRSADEVAEFCLGLRPGDYLDPDWGRLMLLAPTLGRGFGGIVRGEALEETILDWLGDLRLRDLAVPCYAPIWNIEENVLEYVGPETYPDLTVARAIRLSIALPLFIAPVHLDGGWWCDGGVVDVLPVRPLLEHAEAPDAALVVNGFWPPGLAGEPNRTWRDDAFSLLSIESQVRTANHIQHSRDNLARLAQACHVVLLEPVRYDVIRGAGLYRQFFDTRRWPEFMRAGLAEGRLALLEAGRLFHEDADADR
jgi:NTE family protein